ncbi:MAG: lactonase family protein [Bacteroidales bacterium]
MRIFIMPLLHALSALAGIMLLNSCSGQSASEKNDPADKYFLVGTYTGTLPPGNVADSGIFIYRMNGSTGALSQISAGPFTTNPSFLAVHPGKRFVYAVNENQNGEISSFILDTIQMQLRFLNKVSSEGSYPCHLSVSHDGKFVFTANYGSGTVVFLPVTNSGMLAKAVWSDQHQGSGPDKNRQEGPHAHMIIPGTDENTAWSSDLGTDRVYRYNIDPISGMISQKNLPLATIPGSGPRHLAFHPSGNPLYILNELNGTIEVFSTPGNPDSLKRMQAISTLPAGDTSFAGSADIHLTPDGRYLYASNRADINTLAIYRVDSISGILSLLGHQSTAGKSPRNFAIDPSGSFLLVANQKSNNIVVYKINQGTGLLEETGFSTAVPAPVCLVFL